MLSITTLYCLTRSCTLLYSLQCLHIAVRYCTHPLTLHRIPVHHITSHTIYNHPFYSSATFSLTSHSVALMHIKFDLSICHQLIFQCVHVYSMTRYYNILHLVAHFFDVTLQYDTLGERSAPLAARQTGEARQASQGSRGIERVRGDAVYLRPLCCSIFWQIFASIYCDFLPCDSV